MGDKIEFITSNFSLSDDMFAAAIDVLNKNSNIGISVYAHVHIEATKPACRQNSNRNQI